MLASLSKFVALLSLFSCTATSIISANNVISGSTLNAEVAAALKVLDLASASISSFQAKDDLLPFVTVSYAQTIDGSIAPSARTRLDISSKLSFKLLHSLRARHDGVLVGVNTVFADDPQLNVRDPLPGVPLSYPRPVIIDSDLRIIDYPKKLRFTNPIVCTCLEENSERWIETRSLLKEINGTLISCKRDISGRCDLSDCFKSLKIAGINSLLVEGGAKIIQSVLECQLLNQVVVTMRPSFLGGYRSLTHELEYPLHLEDTAAASVGGDIVIFGKVGRGTKDNSNIDSASCFLKNEGEVCVDQVRTPIDFIS